ncbi:hypothetical protein K437DRAFT_273112 [Tilletiaria anomala UBC 951]|uniref:Uncharacterized protein n=1 Tax=Tilletiaria anomala (strain ATCC 24038 / CBS 436.72 / UBC 951) TaxID=1037660 RepID=A0A066WI90_TILAU|nr:uncharacterized protein K437DRAFT_273112 [Tilletiaria anomala UBC 951]KDN50380.1 hypothetical protein K437DRAFT_273112 [Tilletiaria anomala UBC 951]
MPIMVLTNEPHAPIDRIKLPKGFMTDVGALTRAPATKYLRQLQGFTDLLQKEVSVAVDQMFRIKSLPRDAGVFAIGNIVTTPTRDARKDSDAFDKLPVVWSALGRQLRYVGKGNSGKFDAVHPA